MIVGAEASFGRFRVTTLPTVTVANGGHPYDEYVYHVLDTESAMEVLMVWTHGMTAPPKFLYCSPCCHAEPVFGGMERKAICRECREPLGLPPMGFDFMLYSPEVTASPSSHERGEHLFTLWYEQFTGKPLLSIVDGPDLYWELQNTFMCAKRELQVLTENGRAA